MIQDNIVAFENTQLADLGKQRQETTLGDTQPIISACLVALENIDGWTKPEKPVIKDPMRAGWNATVFPTPKGVGLFITYVSMKDPLMFMS